MEEGKEMKNRKRGLMTGDVNSRVVFAGGTGDVSWSLDLEIPSTGADSDVPGGMRLIPPLE